MLHFLARFLAFDLEVLAKKLLLSPESCSLFFAVGIWYSLLLIEPFGLGRGQGSYVPKTCLQSGSSLC